MPADFQLGPVSIGPGLPPLFMPEIGANNDGDPAVAAQMVEELARAGAKVAKFQFYTADELVADTSRVTEWGPAGARRKERVGDMFARLSMKEHDLAGLFRHARGLGVEPFATPFSEAGADKLAELGVKFFKVAASDVTHEPFLRHLGRLGLPVILSLGKCTLGEADRAVDVLLGAGCPSLALLHCIATYPAPHASMNLKVIPMLAQLYPECPIGLSDHSIGPEVAIASVALGGQLVEKHVTLDRARSGPDHWFSLEIREVADTIRMLNNTQAALGQPRKRVEACESSGRDKAVRSISLARDLAAGATLTSADLKVVRPGGGIAPGLFDAVVGLRLARDVPANTQLTWDHLKSA